MKYPDIHFAINKLYIFNTEKTDDFLFIAGYYSGNNLSIVEKTSGKILSGKNDAVDDFIVSIEKTQFIEMPHLYQNFIQGIIEGNIFKKICGFDFSGSHSSMIAAKNREPFPAATQKKEAKEYMKRYIRAEELSMKFNPNRRVRDITACQTIINDIGNVKKLVGKMI